MRGDDVKTGVICANRIKCTCCVAAVKLWSARDAGGSRRSRKRKHTWTISEMLHNADMSMMIAAAAIVPLSLRHSRVVSQPETLRIPCRDVVYTASGGD